MQIKIILIFSLLSCYLGFSSTLAAKNNNQSNLCIIEGDILQTCITKSNYNVPHAAMIPATGDTRWHDGTIPVYFDQNLPENILQSFKTAMQLWKNSSNLKFIIISNLQTNQYTDYLIIMPNNNNVCASFVGKHGGPQPLLLSQRCSSMNMVHEIGHAAGLWHEQSRQDRDQYVKIVWENIQDNHQYNFEKHLNNCIDYGSYNYDSIMHYSAFAFSKNGAPTIIPLQEGIQIGQRDHLSQGDIDAVNRLLEPV